MLSKGMFLFRGDIENNMRKQILKPRLLGERGGPSYVVLDAHNWAV